MIRGKTIELGAFLKWVGAARTGGQAKRMIQEGLVRVNGAVEVRRARDLRGGDVVSVEGWGEAEVVARPEEGDGPGL